ncbi:MAG TPA: peptide ABC transporter ATP-binding protein [Lachnospiraceae bacterium]|nr:peptide ABC transporter ATP-binding protein [Lachnospiraceae bacterium]HBI63388.1 peptide ABC transporter ATP-binding protein [Lachnospiraceae bacterium]
MENQNYIFTRNLTKTYKIGKQKVEALKDVSLQIEKGQMIAIIGSSGSGKSTLLHLLGSLDVPTEGSVLFEGQDIFQWKDRKISEFRRREIGFVFQFFNLFPELTAQENILLPLKIDKKKPEQEFFRQVVEAVGLQERLKHRPEQLSGGQQQRVSIARALLHRPKLLLCDEPTGNLDEKNGNEVIRLLKRANEEWGQTIMIVTHDAKVAESCSRIIEISDGEISESSPENQ